MVLGDSYHGLGSRRHRTLKRSTLASSSSKAASAAGAFSKAPSLASSSSKAASAAGAVWKAASLASSSSKAASMAAAPPPKLAAAPPPGIAALSSEVPPPVGTVVGQPTLSCLLEEVQLRTDDRMARLKFFQQRHASAVVSIISRALHDNMMPRICEAIVSRVEHGVADPHAVYLQWSSVIDHIEPPTLVEYFQRLFCCS
jgi:hypothetical protein